MNNFGKNLEALRLKKGLTQKELAEKTGISRSQINRYEKGKIKNLRNAQEKLLLKELDCTPEELFGYTDGAAYHAPTLPELVNATTTDTNGGKLLDEDGTYPVNSVVLRQHPNGCVVMLNPTINKSEIMDFSHAYFYPEHNISDYSDHICLFRHNDNLMCCRVHIFDDNVVMITNDDKTVVSVDDVEFIGRCVWFEHFDRGL